MPNPPSDMNSIQDGQRVNPRVAWMEKGGRVAVCLDFDFYFFEDQTAEWISVILKNGTTNQCGRIPAAFIEHLHDRRILIDG